MPVLRLNNHQVFSYYHALQLELNGEPSTLEVTRTLNRKAGQRWSTRRWLDTLRPYYDRMIGIPPINPGRPAPTGSPARAARRTAAPR